MDMVGRLNEARPGLMVAAVVGIAATFLSLRTNVSALLFALLLGMALNFLSQDERCRVGIDLASRGLLRAGVALLGLRITVGEIASLGWSTVAMVIAGICLTIGVGILASQWLRLGERFGVLSGGAVAICGASAALAIASVLPKDADSERDASFVIIAVTALSTVAMFLYPVLAVIAGFDDRTAGIFLGGTIHDVAQVVGAGYSVSEQAGNTATIVKLLRVATLLPVCIVIGMVLHVRGRRVGGSAPVLPWFAVVFAILVLLGSVGWVPAAVVDAGNNASRWLLVIALAAIGMKTSLRALAGVGLKAAMLVMGETVVLGAMVFVAVA
ncbi:MAG: putative sulfate exporter family transporter [Betaproteobacteria bacterium]|nr:putative sulfate exporter family transporter [Betaproteobacteria bacterium]